jgi:ribonuclease HI
MNKKLEIYTDGSSLGNPGRGGWGMTVVSNDTIIHEAGGHDKDTTNNRMELQAAIESLKYLVKSDFTNLEVVIHADSAYVLGGITSWIFNWEKNGWKKADKKDVLNKDLWQELIVEVRSFKGKLSWAKVKGHSGHIHNERADEIATTCAAEQKKL